MAMTPRLTDEASAALRSYVAESGRSMQDVAREAIRDCLAARTKRPDEILARIVSVEAELLDLLST